MNHYEPNTAVSGLSINRPKLSPWAVWNPNGTTFAYNQTAGATSNVIFIDKNNNIHLAESSLNRTQSWRYGNATPSRTISPGFGFVQGLFVDNNGDTYIDQGKNGYRVVKWAPNANNGTTVMSNLSGICYSLFVDSNNTLYCSMGGQNQVVKRSLSSHSLAPTLAVGTGSSSNALNALSNPHGIFVKPNFDLYVADCSNNRIMQFPSGQSTGIIVAGNGLAGSISLNCPTEINFDADGYLFIAEFYTHHLMRAIPDGFQCMLGCTGVAGVASNQFNQPYSFSFDTFGNIFVSDQMNSRIQRFSLVSNSYGEHLTLCRRRQRVFIVYIAGFSYNRPAFCSSATWEANATTFANNGTVGLNPYGLFVHVSDTVYVASKSMNQIFVWSNGSSAPTRTLSGSMIGPFAIFAMLNGDLYVDNGYSTGRVDFWSKNLTNRTDAMYVNGSCRGLFIDLGNNLYCSVSTLHQVRKKSANASASTFTIVAGNGTNGSASNMLAQPRAIFVDTNFDLYVADFANHRIQCFVPGQLNGVSRAGTGAAGTITLQYPSGVVLDADGYLFIVDTNNHRIVGAGPNGFRCIVGCSGSAGSKEYQLNSPWTLAFDDNGNLFVADAYNDRIQKFMLATNSCGKSLVPPIADQNQNDMRAGISMNTCNHNRVQLRLFLFCQQSIILCQN